MSPLARGYAIRLAMAVAGAGGLLASAYARDFAPAAGPTWLPPALLQAPAELPTVSVHAQPPPLWRLLAIRGDYPRSAIGLALALALGLAIAGALRAAMRRWPQLMSAAYTLRDALAATSFRQAAVASVAAAVAEEVFFRGFLANQTGLLLAAVAFGLLHRLPSQASTRYAAFACAFGTVAGAIVQITDALGPAMALHATVNLLGVAHLWELHTPLARRRVAIAARRTRAPVVARRKPSTRAATPKLPEVVADATAPAHAPGPARSESQRRTPHSHKS